METFNHIISSDTSEVFKIDLIVWKPPISNPSKSNHSPFKIDLIVWKLAHCAAVATPEASLK